MDKHTELANRAYEVVMASVTSIEAWGFYLTNPAFDSHTELRNRLATFWLCSITDVVEAGSRFLPDIHREAEEYGFHALAYNCRQLQNFCELAVEFLSQFSREEQVYLVDSRNQWVHGYFAGRHRKEIKVKIINDGHLQIEKLEFDEFHKIVHQFHEGGQSVDDVLNPIREKALNMNHRYWHALGVFQRDREKIYEILRSGKTLRITI